MPQEESTLPPVKPDVQWLARQQRTDPGNLRFAHDLGLAHYWRTHVTQEPAQKVNHWLHVIANWAMLLENDYFWRAWVPERAQVYGRTAEEQHVASARDQLRGRLRDEVSQVAGSHSLEAAVELPVVLSLELKAVRLLSATDGFSLPSPPGGQLYCGPLLAAQVGLGAAIHAFFETRPLQPQNTQSLLQILLAPLRRKPAGGLRSAANLDRELRICFSTLGRPLIYIERGDLHPALDLLAALHCPDCHPERRSPSSTAQLVARCRDGCSWFARACPSYAALPGGEDEYVRDAAYLMARVHLALAEQSFAAGDIQALVGHLRQTLVVGQALGLAESLRQEIGEQVLEWSRQLQDREQDTAAIDLLESAGEFDTSGIWRSRLSLLLNQRGVAYANAGQWAQADSDLRRAYALASYTEQIRQNLITVLKHYEERARREGDQDRVHQLSDEIARVEQAEPLVAVDEEPQPPTPSTSHDLARQPVQATPPRHVLVNSDLFDFEGMLKMARFSPSSGQEIIRRASRRALQWGQAAIDLPALTLGLVDLPGGRASRLLRECGLVPDTMTPLAAADRPSGPRNVRLQSEHPSQFDLWIGVIEVLCLAWQAAQELGATEIDEVHILRGMASSPRARNLLQSLHVDVAALASQIRER